MQSLENFSTYLHRYSGIKQGEEIIFIKNHKTLHTKKTKHYYNKLTKKIHPQLIQKKTFRFLDFEFII